MPDAFICDYIRTPIGRYGGALARSAPTTSPRSPIAALVARNPGLDPAAIEDVVLGCANQAGEDNRNVARMAALLAGLPASRARRHGQPPLRLRARGRRRPPPGDPRRRHRPRRGRRGREHDPRALRAAQGRDGVLRAAEIHDTTIGWRFVEPEDAGALRHRFDARDRRERRRRTSGSRAPTRTRSRCRSQQRAAPRHGERPLAAEILPVTCRSAAGERASVDGDEHPRADTTIEACAKLRPSFMPTAPSPPATPRA